MISMILNIEQQADGSFDWKFGWRPEHPTPLELELRDRCKEAVTGMIEQWLMEKGGGDMIRQEFNQQPTKEQ